MTVDFDIIAIGRIAGELQATTGMINRIAKQLGIKPAGLINGVVHFHSKEVDRIAKRLREIDNQTQSTPV